MRLRSTHRQQVRIDELDLDVVFERGEDLRTEISAKFRREPLERELAGAGLEIIGWWTDGDFAVSLSRPADGQGAEQGDEGGPLCDQQGAP